MRWDLELAVLFLAWYDWGNRHDLFGGIFGVMAVTSSKLAQNSQGMQ